MDASWALYFNWVWSIDILDWCDIRGLSEVLDIVGHNFSCLSSVVLNRITLLGNYKIHDNNHYQGHLNGLGDLTHGKGLLCI